MSTLSNICIKTLVNKLTYDNLADLHKEALKHIKLYRVTIFYSKKLYIIGENEKDVIDKVSKNEIYRDNITCDAFSYGVCVICKKSSFDCSCDNNIIVCPVHYYTGECCDKKCKYIANVLGEFSEQEWEFVAKYHFEFRTNSFKIQQLDVIF